MREKNRLIQPVEIAAHVNAQLQRRTKRCADAEKKIASRAGLGRRDSSSNNEKLGSSCVYSEEVFQAGSDRGGTSEWTYTAFHRAVVCVSVPNCQLYPLLCRYRWPILD